MDQKFNSRISTSIAALGGKQAIQSGGGYLEARAKDRQGIGHEVGVTRPEHRFRDDRKLAERLNALEKYLEPW